MNKKTKDKITTLLLILAVLQGPVFFYLTEGLLKALFLMPYALFGLLSSSYLLFFLIKNRSTTTKYHIMGLSVAVIVGFLMIKGDIMEKIDFKLRKGQRLEIVEKLKRGKIKFGDPYYKQWLVNKNDKGVVSIEFYIDRGFLDHYKAFLYTNDPVEMKRLDTIINIPHMSMSKIETNWYRVAY